MGQKALCLKKAGLCTKSKRVRKKIVKETVAELDVELDEMKYENDEEMESKIGCRKELDDFTLILQKAMKPVEGNHGFNAVIQRLFPDSLDKTNFPKRNSQMLMSILLTWETEGMESFISSLLSIATDNLLIIKDMMDYIVSSRDPSEYRNF